MSVVDEVEIGLELSEGRYVILAPIGEGSMGRVYLARDHHLETEVVVKFPITARDSLERPLLVQRFTRETRLLVRLSHPHIVKIIDVGVQEGRPFVVLQYLSGGTLLERRELGPDGPLPMPPASLRIWLTDVARALDFIHAQGLIHRDVKPANILFDAHDNAFLGDFGIVKAIDCELRDQAEASALTAPGFLLATPNYAAPELVMGEPGDGRSDQYSLAMTVHELLCGRNVMAGSTPSATLVNQTRNPIIPLIELVPDLPVGLSEAVQRALEKDPALRFPSCAALAEAILAHTPAATADELRRRPAGVPCPLCKRRIEAVPEQAGELARCPRCRTLYRVSLGAEGTALERVEPAASPFPRSQRTGQPPTLDHLAAVEGASGAVSTTPTLPMPRLEPPRFSRTRTVVGLVLVVAGVTLGLIHLLRSGNPEPPTITTPPPAPPIVEINIAYGTEKRRWLESAFEEFRNRPEARNLKINLFGLGSVEGANAVLSGPKPTPIHVWSPASSAYRDVFETEWTLKHGTDPILRAQELALSPMVFVIWKHRYEKFIQKYGELRLRTIAQAMAEPHGWSSIAQKPEWGVFKFAHTDPGQSNSGVLWLVLMAYEHTGKQRGLTVADVSSSAFEEWLQSFERGVSRHAGKLTHSTGTLMEEMVKRGPSQYDCLLLYENLAIDFMDAARRRWGEDGELFVVYPDPNLWNENPYYILDVPWSTAAQRQAAETFLAFLTSEPIQLRALEFGFRPGNPSVGVDFPESPLVRNAAGGIRIPLPPMCEHPRAEVLTRLLDAYRRLSE